MPKIYPINIDYGDWYRDCAQGGKDNSILEIGFDVLWASKAFSKIHSYGTCGYSDIGWVIVF